MKRCLQCNNFFDSSSWRCPECSFEPSDHSGIRSFAPEFAEGSDGYNPSSYEKVSRFQDEHFWFRGRNELICSLLRKYFPDVKSLLEIGCGTGQILRSVRQANPEMRLCGTEIHTCGLMYAQNCLSDIEFFQMDARRIPFQEEFDLVCAFDVIEHVDDDFSVLRQLCNACRPGGGIMLTVPQHAWLWSSKDEDACHKRRYSRQELLEKVGRAGFDVVMTTSFITLLLPLMYLSRLRERKTKEVRAHRELDVPRLINSAFLACSRFENFLVQSHICLPFGGSLMLIGRKALT